MSTPQFLALLVVLVCAGVAVVEVLRRSTSYRSAPVAAPSESMGDLVDTVIAIAADKFDERLREEGAALDLRDRAIEHNLQLRDSAVRQQVDAMRASLDQVTDLVRSFGSDHRSQHGELVGHITRAVDVQQALTQTTAGLRDALAHPKARGSWGERTADDLLRSLGLLEGSSYVRQRQLANGTRPDVTFLLPDDRLMHMDVKFPADNYLRWCEADNDLDRERYRKAFGADVRARIKETVGRGYLDDAASVDHLLLFIPNEAIYGFIHEHDSSLLDDAMRQRVILCSPFTLFGILTVIRQHVEMFQLERRSDEVLRGLAEFRLQWDKMSDQIDKVDRHAETLRRSLADLSGPRRNQMQRQIDAIRGLELPPSARPTGVDDGAPELALVDVSHRRSG